MPSSQRLRAQEGCDFELARLHFFVAPGSGMDCPDYDDRHLHQVDKRCGRSYIISSQRPLAVSFAPRHSRFCRRRHLSSAHWRKAEAGFAFAVIDTTIWTMHDVLRTNKYVRSIGAFDRERKRIVCIGVIGNICPDLGDEMLFESRVLSLQTLFPLSKRRQPSAKNHKSFKLLK